MMAHVLMVDDDRHSRQIVRDLLESVDGFEIIEAVTGPDGVLAAEAHQPDLILMDIQLPGFDGFEATRRIKANPALQHIPIIAVTSYAMGGDEARAMEAGCDGYLSKPFRPTALLDTIRSFLS
jgi:two-component system cell cycle response regulator DivK